MRIYRISVNFSSFVTNSLLLFKSTFIKFRVILHLFHIHFTLVTYVVLNIRMTCQASVLRRNMIATVLLALLTICLCIILTVEASGCVFIHYLFICCISGMTALLLCYYSIAPCSAKGGISASTICPLWWSL